MSGYNLIPVYTGELMRLDDMLTQAGIPHETREDATMGGANIKVPTLEAWTRWRRPCISVIQYRTSYGGQEGKLELWAHGPRSDNGPVGWLTAEQAFDMITQVFPGVEVTA